MNNPVSHEDVARIVHSFTTDRAVTTCFTYRKAISRFAAWRKMGETECLVDILNSGREAAMELVVRYQELMCRTVAGATVNLNIQAIRSHVNRARTLGLIDWAIDVPFADPQRVRDMRGPSADGVARMIEKITNPRDRAIVRLAYDVTLRRSEIHSLDLSDFDKKAGELSVLLKGKKAKTVLKLPAPTVLAVSSWIENRGTWRGPLFIAQDAGHYEHRLSGTSIYRLILKAGKAVGVVAKPNGLRHSSITRAVTLANGDARSVKSFSRHSGTELVEMYDDASRRSRDDMAETIAEDVDNTMRYPPPNWLPRPADSLIRSKNH